MGLSGRGCAIGAGGDRFVGGGGRGSAMGAGRA